MGQADDPIEQTLADSSAGRDGETGPILPLTEFSEATIGPTLARDAVWHGLEATIGPTLGPEPVADLTIAEGSAKVGPTPGADETIASDPAATAPSTRPGRALPFLPGYVIEAEIGRGGMGVVYRARSVRLNRTVALKMILAGDHAGTEASVRFLVEAEAIARLQHPNIVQIFHINEHEGRPYFEMEYVGGGSLADRLDGQPRPPTVAARLVARLARAVAEAHRGGIVHRDLKPANILLAEDGTPKVADFGLAKSIAADSGLTRTDSILGSPSYMAPEQAEGKTREVGAAADIYALGAILYEQLTGRPPFVGASVLDTLAQVKEAEPVAPARLVPGLARDVETIALKCLEKSPARRYPSAADLAVDLEQFLAGEPILARPVPFWERGWKWAARRPAVAALLLALAGLSGALLGGGVISYARIQAALTEAHDQRAQALAARSEEADARRRAEADRARADRAKVQADAARVQADEARNAALSETYRAALSETRALRAAHLLGWRDDALGNLARLATLPTPRRDLAELRSEAVACLGDFDIREVARFDASRGEAFGLDFSADGQTLATAHRNGVLRLWDVTRPAHLASYVGPGESPSRAWGWPASGEPWPSVRRGTAGNGLIFNPDGHGAALAEFSQTRTGRPLFDRDGMSSTGLASDAAGRRIAVGWNDGRVDVFDSATGSVLRTDSTAFPRAFALSPDGRWLALVGPDGSIRLQPVEGNGPAVALGKSRDRVTAIAFSPDGATLATGSADFTTMLWDVARRESRFPLLGHKQRVTCVTFSADGEWIATGGDDHTVRLWEARTGVELAVLEQPQFVVAVAFSPAGDHLATACVFDSSVRLYRIEGRAERRRLVGHTTGLERLAFHPRLPRLVTGEVAGQIILWDTTTGRALRQWSAHGSHINSLAFSPDGSVLASGGGPRDTTARLWDAETGTLIRTLSGHKFSVTALAFDRSGRRVVTGDHSGSLFVWDATTGQILSPEIKLFGPLANLVFADDDRHLLAQPNQGPLQVLDPTGGEPPRSVASPGDAVSFLMDWGRSRALVGDSVGQLTAVPWPKLGPGLGTEGVHKGPVLILALSPDGKLIASGGEDRRVVLSDAANLKPLLRFPARIGRVKTLGFDASGTKLAVGGIDSEAVIWDLDLLRAELRAANLAWDGPKPTPGRTGSLAPPPSPPESPAVPTIPLQRIDPTEIRGADEWLRSAPWASSRGQLAEAIVLHEEAVATFRRVARANLDDARALGRLAVALGRLGVMLEGAGRRDAAQAALGESRVILEGLTAPSPEELRALASTYSRLGGMAERAVATLGRAIEAGLPAGVDLAADPDFASIRDRADFRGVLLDRPFPRDPFAEPRPQPDPVRPPPRPVASAGEVYPGVGVMTRSVPDGLWINRITPGGPAESDGRLRPGDLILGLEHEGGRVELLAAGSARTLRGEVGSSVRLIVRTGDARRVFYELTRQPIHIPAWFARVQELDRAIDNLSGTPAHRIERGNILASHGDWAGALADLKSALELDPANHQSWYSAAPLYLQLGDRAGYRRHCLAMLARFEATADPMLAERTAKACLLDSEPPPVELARLVALADRSLALPSHPGLKPYLQLCRGMAALRAGQAADATDRMAPLSGQGHPPNCDAMATLFLALADRLEGRPAAARGHLRVAARSPLFTIPPAESTPPIDSTWHDRLMTDLVRREAEAIILLDPVFPADPFAQ